MWVFHNSTSGVSQLLDKQAGVGRVRLARNGANPIFFVNRATTNLDIQPLGSIAANKWMFVAATYDINGADGDQHLYEGESDLPAVEFASYVSRNVGSGAQGDDSSADQHISEPTGGTQGLDGHIGVAGIWNRQLSLGEIREQQFRPHPTKGCTLLVFPNSAGPVRDISPFRVLGAATGVSMADYRPLPVTVDMGLVRSSTGFVSAIRDPIFSRGVIPFAG